MLNNKTYFKEYYQKNREKILFRVKSNYAKNKFMKAQPEQKEQQLQPTTKIVKGPIIVSFD
jgi:hypothetical protein